MKFFEQKIPSVYIIEPEPVIDNRGIFRRNFCQREFKEHNIVSDIRQASISENKFRHTLRGFHYQLSPYQEAKTISCLTGAIYDIVVDLRQESTTYLEWISVELNTENRRSLHIPIGCANAFLTLQDNSVVHYYSSELYHPEAERGIRYNDPFFRFKWPVEPKIISEKDRKHPNFIVSSKPK